uniref:Uncharacterized protein n=1 Tax=Oryza meridionalis TaxID=40149 RepID=A0A0E0E6W2_9ORYZ
MEEIGKGGRRWRCGRERSARAEQIGERPPVVMRTGETGSEAIRRSTTWLSLVTPTGEIRVGGANR